MRKTMMLFAGLALSTATLSAAEKGLMHCFAFTEKEGAAQADWDAFKKATDALPNEIKGLKMVWHGKLMRPLSQFQPQVQGAEGQKELMAKMQANNGVANADVKRNMRSYGACMAFADEAAFKAYGAKDNMAHTKWTEAYSKVMVPGTTTYQILSQ